MTNIDRVASAIVAARRVRVQVPALAPELAPKGVEDAYAIQDASMQLLGPVGGWKANMSGELRCAPMPVDAISQTPARMPADRPYKVEAEIGIMFGQDLTEPQSADTIRGAIASIHPTIEVVLSRFYDKVPMEQGLADCQSHEATIIGDAIKGWQSSGLVGTQLALLIDGKAVATTSEGASLDAMLPALAWLANHTLARGWPLRKGHTVITGARLKTQAPEGPCRVVVEANGRPSVALDLV